ncbi:MAG: hypothetical protein GY710_17370 [Desulfobacteraceae bacterium]|nr:hypothetical protein [Desulfobacteraceae bacterium]
MPTLDDVYRKFGETSEAAQLLETQLGTMLIMNKCIEENIMENPNPEKASEIFKEINKYTLGRLIRKLSNNDDSISHLEELLSEALKIRNRLAHSFYLGHNLRRNSEDGRVIMLKDLQSVHDKLLEAYKAVMLLNGTDLDKMVAENVYMQLPTGHLPI